ncbi:hypothetical protein [Streptomyces sp. NPDC056660]|uniref:hypothetical protein n=1 Tax=Streptomyces sp. NPDC056660 TaxID=3345897 RepID=UPI00367E11BA
MGVHLDPAAGTGGAQQQGGAGAFGCHAFAAVGWSEALLQGGVAVQENVEQQGFGEAADAEQSVP